MSPHPAGHFLPSKIFPSQPMLHPWTHHRPTHSAARDADSPLHPPTASIRLRTTLHPPPSTPTTPFQTNPQSQTQAILIPPVPLAKPTHPAIASTPRTLQRISPRSVVHRPAAPPLPTPPNSPKSRHTKDLPQLFGHSPPVPRPRTRPHHPTPVIDSAGSPIRPPKLMCGSDLPNPFRCAVDLHPPRHTLRA